MRKLSAELWNSNKEISQRASEESFDRRIFMRSMNENYRLLCLDRTIGFVPDLHLRMCFDRGPQEKLNKMPFRKFPERKLGRNPFRRRVQGQKLSSAPDFQFPGEETWTVDQICDAFGRFLNSFSGNFFMRKSALEIG